MRIVFESAAFGIGFVAAVAGIWAIGIAVNWYCAASVAAWVIWGILMWVLWGKTHK